MTDAELIRRAGEVTRPRALGKTVEAGAVGAAILAGSGVVFCGVSIDAACGIAFAPNMAPWPRWSLRGRAGLWQWSRSMPLAMSSPPAAVAASW